MTYKAWKKALAHDLNKTSFRDTAKKWGLTTTTLQNFKRAALLGDEYAGLTTWKHWLVKQAPK